MRFIAFVSPAKICIQSLSSIVVQEKKSYNRSVKRTSLSLLLCSALLLAHCGRNQSGPEALPDAFGARSALRSTLDLSLGRGMEARPSATLGIFTTLYLAQGIFLPVRSALTGIEAQLRLLAGLRVPGRDETFALLQEFGAILDVDVIDALNRSEERAQTLDQYLESLHNLTALAGRKIIDLQTEIESVQETRKQEQRVARDLDKKIKGALKQKDYGTAAALQPELTEAESRLAETEAREEQTDDLLEHCRGRMEIREARLRAIERNREIIIAGLRVIDVPGIEELRILLQGRSQKRSRNRSIFGS